MSRRLLVAIFVVALTVRGGQGQQPSVSASREHVKVYANTAGLTPPQLLPLNLPPPQVDNCKRKIDGDVVLSILVDTSGAARNIMFVRPVGSEADVFALNIAGADRFRPGTLDGKAVVTAASLKIKIRSCLVEMKNSDGTPNYSARLRAVPTQELRGPADPPEVAVLTSPIFDWGKFANDHPRIDPSKWNSLSPSKPAGAGSDPITKHPIPIFQPEATYTEEARKKKINGSCLLTLLVDEQGMPQIPRMERSLDPGLDLNALAAVGRYRFKPAMRDGEPVPAWIAIEVTFKIW